MLSLVSTHTCKWVAACDALCKDEHVWVHAVKVLVAPPLARAPRTRLHLCGVSARYRAREAGGRMGGGGGAHHIL